MKDFSKHIPAGLDFNPEFIFQVLHNGSGKLRYHVSVLDWNKNSVFFTMEQKDNGSWKIIDAPKVPEWIMNIEKHLDDAIIENLAQ